VASATEMGREMAVVVRPDVVNESVAELVRARMHEHFAGYLCMVRTAARDGSTTNLKPDFVEFFDTFLAVPNAPDGRPYLRPFNRAGSGPLSWNQANVAGSYAPSSIRPNMAFASVVEINGQGTSATYSLRNGHARLALEHLAHGQKVPVVPLAIFLYRDFALLTEGDPSAAHLVQMLRHEFGYEDADGRVSDDFRVLYADESEVGSTAAMFDEAPA
jgi:hypothetical protein